VHSEIPPHEKIRFRRCDIAPLDSLPSAIALPPPARLSAAAGRTLRIAGAIIVGVSAAVILAVGVIIAGLGDEQLRREAQRMVTMMAPEDQQVDIGHVSVSLDGMRGLALQVNDLSIVQRDSTERGAHAGSVRIGLDILPLLKGQIRPRSLSIADASIPLSALPATQGGQGLAIFDEAGLVDPDRDHRHQRGHAQRVHPLNQ